MRNEIEIAIQTWAGFCRPDSTEPESMRQMNRVLGPMLFLLVVLILPFFAGGIASAQATDGDLQMRVEEAQSLVRESLREVLREELMLTDEESRRFWPVYGGYEEERIAIADRYTRILTEFVTRYRQGTLGDRDADRLLDGYLDVKNDTIRLRKRYVGKFRRVLPGVKVTRFYQLENKIQADVDAVLARTVPLADPR